MTVVTQSCTSPLLDAALAYASYGLHVFPLGPNSKRPLTDSELGLNHGEKDATTDSEAICRWWAAHPDANVGVATGPSRLVVIDVDGPGGEDTLDFLERNLDLFLDTTRTSTTGTGLHHWYRRPADAEGIRFPQGTNALGPHVDIKADTGYVVAPPSLHPSGRSYVWNSPPGTPFAPLPDWVTKQHAKPARTVRPSTSTPFLAGDGTTTAWGATALTGECHAVRNTPEGGRNEALNNAAWRIGQVIGGGNLDPQEATDALLAAATVAGLPFSEAAGVINRALAAGVDTPRGPELHTLPPNWNPAAPNATLDAAQDAALAALTSPLYAPSEPLEATTEPSEDDLDEDWEPPPIDQPVRDAIQVNNQALDATVSRAIKAIILGNGHRLPRVYQKGDQLVRIRAVTNRQVNGEPEETVLLQPYDAMSMKQHLSEVSRWIKRTVDKAKTAAAQEADPAATPVVSEVDVSPPTEVAETILAMPEFSKRIPFCQGVIESPVMRADGTVLSRPGYDKATALIYYPMRSVVSVSVPDSPTEAQVQGALALLEEPFADFPFTDDASKANMFALLLSPVLRPAIDGPAPIALVSATMPGTGKSLLCDVVSTISTGKPTSFTTAPLNEEEWQKVLLSQLQAGSTFTIFDNLRKSFTSGSLCAALTAPSFTGRVLGSTRMASYPVSTTWAATGNNISTDSEIGRRSYWITLDARTSKPAERTRDSFQHPQLLRYCTENRQMLVNAMLTLCRAWWAAGCPEAENYTMGSYEEWTRIVGGVLCHAGIKGFLQNAGSQAQEADSESQEWQAVLEFLSDSSRCGQGKEFTSSDAANTINIGDNNPLTGLPLGGNLDLVPISLVKYLGRDSFNRMLGEGFSGIKGRRFGTRQIRIERAGFTRAKVVAWIIREGR